MMKGYISITWEGNVRYIAIPHIVPFNALTGRGEGSVIKTDDGFCHKAEEPVGDIMNQLRQSSL